MTITKKDSDLLKGIAIIMMMIHHFWNPITQPIPLKICLGDVIMPNVEVYIAKTCKVCVSIFAFLSGYVLWLNREKNSSFSYIGNKVRSFLLNYWLIEMIFICLAVVFVIKLPPFNKFIANLFGFEVGAYEILGYDYVNVIHAWYVRFYLCLLITSPILLKLFNWADRFNHIIVFSSFVVICGATYLYCRNSDIYIMKKMVAVYFQWIPSVIFGYYTCRYGWLMKMMDIKHCTVLLVLLLILRNSVPYFFMFDFISVLLIVTIAIRATPPNLKKIFIWLGKLSMTIWFVHGIFFLHNAPFGKLIQWNSFTILIMGGLYSVLFSYLIYLFKRKFSINHGRI